MADSKITDLAARTGVVETDVVPVVGSGGPTQKATVGRLRGRVSNVSTAAQALTAGTTAQALTGSNLALPVAPSVATIVRWSILLQKTSAAGTAGLVFVLRGGTAGTTADASLATHTFGASTAVADNGRLDIQATFRSVGASTTAVIYSGATLTHSLASTGLLSVPAQTLMAASSGFDSTQTGLILGLSCTPGASNTISIQQVVAEVINI